MSLRRVGWSVLTLLLFGGLVTDVARAGDGWPSGWQGELGVVFAVPGAGNFPGLHSSMQAALARADFPLRVVKFEWSQGGGLLSDMMDRASHHTGGRALAQRILCYRQANPGGKVYLISHSAGSAVLLAATQYLPPGSVERIVLLAPTTSCHYDLRWALGVSRCGIDLFFSPSDNTLDFCGDVLGTSEGRCGRTAGQVGFAPVTTSPADVRLYAKLHQHPWRLVYNEVGYNGGHFSVVNRHFFCRYVVPMLMVP